MAFTHGFYASGGASHKFMASCGATCRLRRGWCMRMVHHGERSRPCHSNLSALPSALDSIMRGWDKGGPCTQTTLVGRPPKAKRRPEGARRGSECTCPTAPQEVEAAVAADDGHAATAQRWWRCRWRGVALAAMAASRSAPAGMATISRNAAANAASLESRLRPVGAVAMPVVARGAAAA